MRNMNIDNDFGMDNDDDDDDGPVRPAELSTTAALAGERAQEQLDPARRPNRDLDQPLSVKDLFEAGVHFGHQTKRWNPKMKSYIYGARSGIHIIDLDQTARLFKKAFEFILNTVSRGGTVLFVGTKRQAAIIVQEEATRAGMYYVTNRWLGGTLTNFRTMKGGLDRLRALERMREDGTYEQLPKKETVQLDKERARLEKHIGGLKGMGSVPQVMVIIDPAQESIAVSEARKLKIPIVATTDTNCDPDLVDFVIPGNDDAIRSVRLICSALADACIMGTGRRREYLSGKEKSGEGQGRSSGPEAHVIYAGRPRQQQGA
jgi:small subunit ribosomal protein S2